MAHSKLLLLVCILLGFVSMISAQEITRFTGLLGNQYYQDEQRISKKEISNLMRNNELTNFYWSKSKLHQQISNGSFVASFVLLYWYAASNDGLNNGGSFSLTPKLIGFFGASGISIGFSLSARTLRKKGILSYNRIVSEDKVSVYFGQTINGLGLVCSF